jgi:microcystin degradation protein MlrC
MTQRIAIGGFLHESHSFAPHPTTFGDFLHPAGFPPLTEGAAMVDAVRGTSVPSAGALAVAESEGIEVTPLAWSFANPAGPVQDEAFERIAALICAQLSRALAAAKLDGVYLDLHGAAVAESFPDAEGEVLRRVRAIVGATPIAISLDPHANLTSQMVALADAVVPFRTYPHVDMKDAGGQAMRLLLRRIGRGAPWARAFRQLDFWIPIGSQCTLLQPMQAVMAERASLAERLDATELAFCFGFPYADFADCGPAIAAYADTQAMADGAADAFAAHVAARESAFVQDTLPAAEAVAEARRLAAGASKPIVITDTQDNPGGGGHGDTTGLLAELVRQKAAGAVLCLINDAASVAACHAAGEGAAVALSLGGKSDGMPFDCAARVVKLTDGRFTLTGPMGAGNRAIWDRARCSTSPACA